MWRRLRRWWWRMWRRRRWWMWRWMRRRRWRRRLWRRLWLWTKKAFGSSPTNGCQCCLDIKLFTLTYFCILRFVILVIVH
ncbi:unnamed protein product [Meloidogyne enterolobii]|uniref:Uncharacterized protein n=2 Tax=Meloidogyne enterolobii TaxID=390850 RepID=A0ACB1A690_MELEN|nr:unnamed protein product [Meloidogyne enterolobii]